MRNLTKTSSCHCATDKQPPSKRLFIALLPDRHTIDRIAVLQKQLPGRIVAVQNLHLTLAFLGNQPEDVCAPLIRFLGKTAFQPFELILDTIGHFPKIRLSWLGPSIIPDTLQHLHQNIREYLIQHRLSDGHERFRPHITLARQSSPSRQTLEPPVKWQVTRLVLIQSILGNTHGSHPEYRILYEKKAILRNS